MSPRIRPEVLLNLRSGATPMLCDLLAVLGTRATRSGRSVVQGVIHEPEDEPQHPLPRAPGGARRRHKGEGEKTWSENGWADGWKRVDWGGRVDQRGRIRR